MAQRLNAGPVPLYHQLKEVLRNEIERGVYKPGDRLPSEPELMREYGVSRITVRQALDELEAEELILRRHGKGTYVAERRIEQELVRLTDFMEDMQQAGQNPSSRVLVCVHEQATPAVVRALHLKEGTEVVRVDRLRLANGRPIAFDTTWLPLRFGELLTGMNLAEETIYHILETRYSIPVISGAFSITATTADKRQADLLDISPGAALLLIQRISYTTGDEPVYVQDRYYRPDRVQYRVMLRRHDDAARNSTINEFRPVFEEQFEGGR
ncbi:MAG TPA: GntR family transcriptional regulator [Ktedonobacteraceae bacterium]|jgi:GntR family transcriptional regulator|nr:GntR family transcriptional regulator [Ktedonobacteraceae bacterium]